MGIFDDAGISLNDLPNDPFGFGKEYWPVEIVDVRAPDVSSSGKQYGTMIKWKCIAPQFLNMESLGFGNWLQLPPPKHVLDTLPDMEFDPKSDRGRRAIFQISQLFKGLGIPQDQWNDIEITDLKGRQCMAKIFVKQDQESGFWQFNITGQKPIPEGTADGMSMFAGGDSSNSAPSGDMSEIDRLLAAETKNAGKGDKK